MRFHEGGSSVLSAVTRGLVAATFTGAVLGLSAVAAVPQTASQATQAEMRLVALGDAHLNKAAPLAASSLGPMFGVSKHQSKADPKPRPPRDPCQDKSNRPCNRPNPQPKPSVPCRPQACASIY